MGSEVAIIFLVILIVGAVQLTAFVLSVIALVKSKQVTILEKRIADLEAAARVPIESPASPEILEPAPEPVASSPREEPQAEVITAEVVVAPPARRASTPFQWERFIGEKALGWFAVGLLVLAAAFFLRYAYKNSWIGPMGRVTIGALTGAALLLAGQRYLRHGWRTFGQMLSGAGVVVVYLATYSAFGFYHLLPREHAGLFLTILVLESMVLAAYYHSLSIALVAVIGGLITPLLLSSGQDIYPVLFTYLIALNLGVVVLMVMRNWPAFGSISLLGTHGLFWSWHASNYHPEKLSWALGFHLILYGMYLGQSIVARRIRRHEDNWESLGRMVVNAVLAFTAIYVLLSQDYRDWMGCAAIVAAMAYLLVGRLALVPNQAMSRWVLTSLAIAIGFLALALPIQAEAHWVAFGWTAMATALWWFGLRIDALALRAISGILTGFAVIRVLFVGLPNYDWGQLVTPIFNEIALPSIGVTALILFAAMITRNFKSKLDISERMLVAAIGVGGILLLWLILSVDCYAYFEGRAIQTDADRMQQRWLGQLSLSVLWTFYAAGVLSMGFYLRNSALRWVALGLFGITVGKVLFIDMANLEQLYRILAFVVLAAVLALAARAYQRLARSNSKAESEGN